MHLYDDIRPGDSFEKWHHATCRNYSLTQCRAIPDPSFEASVAVRPWGSLAVSHIASRLRSPSTLVVERGAAEIRRDHRDDFFIWVGLEGQATLSQSGASATIGAGDLMLMDQARPFSLGFGAESATLMIIVPRALWQARLPRTDALLGRRLDAGAATTRLAVAMARHCAELSQAEDAETVPERTRLAALDVLSTAFEAAETHAPTTRDRASARLRDVQRYLEAHLDDAELTLADIARAHHMSVRTLIRLVALEGTTPMRWLWAIRLQKSRQALELGRYPRVSDVAAAHGFKDPSHYSRAFKSAFGVAPQELLRLR